MFNKNNKKKLESEYLKSAKIHIMKNDLSGEVTVAPEKEDDIRDNPALKGGSPFLSERDNLAKVKSAPEAVEVRNELPKKEDNLIAQEPIENNVPSGYPHIKTPQELYAAETRNKETNYFEESQASGGWSAWGFVSFLVIMLLFGVGGYYLWSSRDGKTEGGFSGIGKLINFGKEDSLSDDFSQKDVSIDTINDLSDNKNTFSDKANFMVLNDEDLSLEGIGRTITNKFIEMEKYEGRQLEFLIVDKNNKPIVFNDFADKFKISLGPEVLSSLTLDNFSLFLYRDKDIKRIGLVVAVKNKDSLKLALAKNEKKLIKDFNSLFLNEKPDAVLASKVFSQSEYAGSQIRYINLNKNLNLSLDYSISGEYFIIATNKDSGRLIIDKIASESVGKKDVFSPEK